MHIDPQNLTLLRQICEFQPESMIWATPVYEQNSPPEHKKIVDFQFQYCNTASSFITGKSKSEFICKYILEDQLPDPGNSKVIFEQCLHVYQTAEPMEFSYYSAALGKHLQLQHSRVLDGVLTTARNRTREQNAWDEKEKQSLLLSNLIDSSPYGICVYESVRDKSGKIIDFKLRLANQKSAEITALTMEDLYTKTVKGLMAIRGNSRYFEICEQVVETGEPQYLEYYSETRKQWLAFSIVKFEDGYLLNYIDTTETKRFENEATKNAHELAALFNGSLSAMYSAKLVRDSNGKLTDLIFLRVNDSFCKMFNSTAENIIGKSLLNISNDDDQSGFLNYVQEVSLSGQSAVHELHYHYPERWFEFSLVKLDPETVSVTVNDITIQKLAGLEIERQKNLLDNIMRHSPSGLAVTEAIINENGEMTDAINVLMNDACEKLNGVSNELLLTNKIGSINPSLLKSPIFEIASRLNTGESFRAEYFLEQTKKWVELAIAKMDETHFINVFTDITPIKLAHQQLEKSVADLQRSNANLEDFAYAASHDLKDPIRKIRMFTEQIKKACANHVDEKTVKNFERLELAADRMYLLIEDLLSYSHANQGVGETEPVNMKDEMREVLEDHEMIVAEKKAMISVGQLPTINGNKRQIHQLFQNLISNALKYQFPGRAPVISVSSLIVKGSQINIPISEDEQEDAFYLIEVKDNGIGFEQKDAEKIFKVFTRLHGKQEYAGTGVGLSIVRKVIDNHNGYVRAVGNPGAGSTFQLYFPKII